MSLHPGTRCQASLAAPPERVDEQSHFVASFHIPSTLVYPTARWGGLVSTFGVADKFICMGFSKNRAHGTQPIYPHACNFRTWRKPALLPPIHIYIYTYIIYSYICKAIALHLHIPKKLVQGNCGCRARLHLPQTSRVTTLFGTTCLAVITAYCIGIAQFSSIQHITAFIIHTFAVYLYGTFVLFCFAFLFPLHFSTYLTKLLQTYIPNYPYHKLQYNQLYYMAQLRKLLFPMSRVNLQVQPQVMLRGEGLG